MFEPVDKLYVSTGKRNLYVSVHYEKKKEENWKHSRKFEKPLWLLLYDSHVADHMIIRINLESVTIFVTLYDKYKWFYETPKRKYLYFVNFVFIYVVFKFFETM